MTVAERAAGPAPDHGSSGEPGHLAAAAAQPDAGPAGHAAPPWRVLGAGLGVLGGEGLAGCLRPALGEALAVADLIVPLALVVTLIMAVLCGSDLTVERVFRLLRWAANRPEPPAPHPARQLAGRAVTGDPRDSGRAPRSAL